MDRVVTVGLVDDHALIRDGLERVCATHANLRVVYSGHCLEVLLATTPAPALVLLDLDLGDHVITPTEVEAILDRGSAVLVISALGHPDSVRAMVSLGIAGFVSKRESEAVLHEAIDAVLAGGSWTTPDLAAILSRSPHRPVLSEQEQRALVLYASGLKIQSVARRLNVKPSTAREYIERVRAKYAAVGRPAPTKVHLHTVAQEDGLLVE